VSDIWIFVSGQGILGKLVVSVRRFLPGFISACCLRAVFLFVAKTDEKVGCLCSIS